MTKTSLTAWSGVFPAVTTQFAEDLSVDPAATRKVIEGLVDDGVHGLVVLGTVGENNSLSADEKRLVLETAVEATAGRVPIITGVSDFTTSGAIRFARQVQTLGVDGLMLLPAMVYMPDDRELVAHFQSVASETDLPIMLYNNPASYRVNISLSALDRLADISNIVAVKESAADTRRFTDMYNVLGDRMQIFAGLDDMAFEGLVLGAVGWISGLTNAFPKESVALYEFIRRGELERALALYRWFMPLLHLDSQSNLVQCIKLSEQVMGRGSERVRMPRLTLAGDERAAIVAMVEKARATRPSLD